VGARHPDKFAVTAGRRRGILRVDTKHPWHLVWEGAGGGRVVFKVTTGGEMIRPYLAIALGLIVVHSGLAQDRKADYATPPSTYETYLRAILAKDLKGAVACHNLTGERDPDYLVAKGDVSSTGWRRARNDLPALIGGRRPGMEPVAVGCAKSEPARQWYAGEHRLGGRLSRHGGPGAHGLGLLLLLHGGRPEPANRWPFRQVGRSHRNPRPRLDGEGRRAQVAEGVADLLFSVCHEGIRDRPRIFVPVGRPEARSQPS
jgi:hypothetical protein